jgi:hypothetical protein
MGLMMPNRLIDFDLGEAKIVESAGKEVLLRFRKTIRLTDTSGNEFEIVASELKALELNSSEDRKKPHDHS